MMNGETVATGGSNSCEECGNLKGPIICHSFAGYYIGYECDCGPHSRESDYYKTYKEADTALASGDYGR